MNKLLPIYLPLVATLICFTVYAKEEPALAPINEIFDAMRNHDGDKFLSQFTETAHLERITQSNEIKMSDLKNFADFISKSTKHLDEQLFNIKILVSGNLASAWTPFAFYVDKKLSHCGVNSFQLVKQQTQWKIQYLIDNVYTGDCEQFIKAQKAQIKTN